MQHCAEYSVADVKKHNETEGIRSDDQFARAADSESAGKPGADGRHKRPAGNDNPPEPAGRSLYRGLQGSIHVPRAQHQHVDKSQHGGDKNQKADGVAGADDGGGDFVATEQGGSW